MSTPRPPGKKTAPKKSKAKVKDLVPKKNPKGGPTQQSKRTVVLKSGP